MKALPYKKPSSLLAAALRDLQAVRRRKNVKIDMMTWVSKDRESCSVCLAGSTLVARGLVDDGVPPELKSIWDDNSLEITHLDRKLYMQLLALNDFRRGRIHSALYHLDLSMQHYNDVPKWVDTPKGRAAFYKSMRDIIALLRKAGL